MAFFTSSLLGSLLKGTLRTLQALGLRIFFKDLEHRMLAFRMLAWGPKAGMCSWVKTVLSCFCFLLCVYCCLTDCFIWLLVCLLACLFVSVFLFGCASFVPQIGLCVLRLRAGPRFFFPLGLARLGLWSKGWPPGPVVLWSRTPRPSRPVVTWSRGPLVPLVPLVPWSLGPLVFGCGSWKVMNTAKSSMWSF